MSCYSVQMYYCGIIICIFIFLSKMSVAYITCKQTCPDLHKCELNKLNETCLMMENGSCIPDEKTPYGKDIKPSIVKLTYKRKIWMISWEPPEDVEFRYNGFIITILMNSSTIFNYYMKTYEASTFSMQCSLEYTYKRHSVISEVCVQTLPKSSLYLSQGVQECIFIRKESRPTVKQLSKLTYGLHTTRLRPFTELPSTTQYSSYLGDDDHTSVIAAVVVSTIVVVSALLGIILYIFSKRKQRKCDSNSETDIANCPVHGVMSSVDKQTTAPNNLQGSKPVSSNTLNANQQNNNKPWSEHCFRSLPSREDQNNKYRYQMDELSDSEIKLFQINFGD